MIINIQDDILTLHNQGLLKKLLEDKTTKKNIMWATDAYSAFGERYFRNEEIRQELITGSNSDIIKTRARKELEHQAERTKQRAEVFTPLWICKRMNDDAERYWFEDVIDNNDDIENKDYVDTVIKDKKLFKKYIDSKRLEITCGEAPYLVSRYDVATGEMIPVEKRIGLLDRKIQTISRYAHTEDGWFSWVIRAYQSIFGYEFQGDNVLIARVNMILSLSEHMQERWGRKPTKKELEKIANIVSWNIWQMDGLTLTIPYSEAEEHYKQLDWFGLLEDEDNQEVKQEENIQPYCRIYDWHNKKRSVEFQELKKGMHMKFDFIIGNPPYQEEQVSNNADGSLKNYAPPIYDKFMEEAFCVADRVELIHPARFLFNAGSTPKAWNEKMLNDKHFKVLLYEEDGHKIFPSLTTPLRGGVAITYRDVNKQFGAIQAFTKYQEVNNILQKVIHNDGFESLMDIVYSRTSYRFTNVMHEEHPEVRYKEDSRGNNVGFLSKGHDYDMSSNVMSLVPFIFFEKEPKDGNKYISILGRINNQRIYRFIKRDYVRKTENLDSYKVFVPQANGSGEFGESMSEPVVEGPGVGSTETFLSIGCFNTREEAVAVEKYIKTKFARTMLSVLKVTQNGNKPVWKYVPLQDFTKSSDIDWTKSISDIDHQLYKKYGLNKEEVDFIETHVKEMK